MTDQHPDAEAPPEEVGAEAGDATQTVGGDDRGVDAEEAPSSESEVRTGNDAVDAVLRSLEGLDETPLEEHPGAFERAHDALRGALADARGGPSEAES